MIFEIIGLVVLFAIVLGGGFFAGYERGQRQRVEELEPRIERLELYVSEERKP